MSVSIQIPAYSIDALKEALEKELAGKNEELNRIQRECEEIVELITHLDVAKSIDEAVGNSASSASELAKEFGYNEKWTWVQKIKFAIQRKGNIGMTTSQIAEELAFFEPNVYNMKKSRAKAIASISAILSMKAKDGKVFYRRTNDMNENLYYLTPF